ncbi:hypothetical protein ACLGGT_14290 [Roseovarius sp. MS2]|uniref:hypothetical protein n=1 Tax=Roseovarius sp. MS2 TaxID=3390728 RepID=UPI003EDB8908
MDELIPTAMDDLAGIPSKDLSTGGKVMVGDHNWRRAPLSRRVRIFLFGRRERITHLGMRCTVAWWREQPYLIWIAEARP